MAGPPDDHYALVGKRIGFRLAYIDALHDDREAWGIFRLDDHPVKVRYNSTTIHDVINDTPNTAGLTIDAATPPTVGQRLTIKINANKPRTLFAGPLQTVGLTYEGRGPDGHTIYPCQAIDDTPLANRKLPYGAWTNVSATTIAQYLVGNFCPADFSAAAVQANLPPVSVNFDSTEGLDGCLRQLAKLIGGYFYWEDRVLHLFTDAEPGDTPDPIDALHPFLNDPPISISTDTSQVRTRVYGKGYAEEVIADVAAGDAIVPISNAVMFNPAGGKAVTETQRLAYAGTTPGGGGTVVGPGISPAAAPVATLQAGAGITPGAHEYAVSFITAAGESLPGPRVAVTTGALPAPSTPLTATQLAGGNGPEAGGHYYATTFITPAGETVPGPSTWAGPTTISVGSAAIVIADDPTSFGYGELTPGGTVRLWFTYSANPDRSNPPPANGLNETGYSNPSAVWTILQYSPGYGRGFAMYIPMSQDPNVKTVHIWISLNGAPLKLLATQSGSAIPNQPGGGSTWYTTYVSGGITSTPQLTGANPIVGSYALAAIPLGPAGVTQRKVYRSKANTIGPQYLLATLNDNTTPTYTDASPDAALGALAPTIGTAQAAQVQLTGIPIGSATVTQRMIYRTAAGAGQLKRLSGIADNTTTAYLDVLADASLGTNAPTGDTSGIQQPAGVVLAGAASIIVAGAGWAVAAGGWAIIGNGQQTIRYTGISGNTLTGIPPTGPGAITATVSYNSTITGAAALRGVTGLLRALIKGAPINLWVQRDALAAQASIAAVDHTDGVIEHLLTDERRGEASLIQLCDADLDQYAQPIQTVPYATRDTKTKSGKPVTFNLDSPAIYGTLTIQDVTITEINVAKRLNPKFTATASSVRFSLDDILRRLGAALDVTS
jgi:hypothetical protein